MGVRLREVRRVSSIIDEMACAQGDHLWVAAPQVNSRGCFLCERVEVGDRIGGWTNADDVFVEGSFLRPQAADILRDARTVAYRLTGDERWETTTCNPVGCA